MPPPRRALTTGRVSRRAVLALGAAATVAACSSPGTRAQPSRSAAPSPSSSPSGEPHPQSADPSGMGLSRKQQAGQRVIFSYPGPTPPQTLLADIEDGIVGGVIFFTENVSSSGQLRSVVKQLVAAHARGPVKPPLLLMSDQEGGQVRRLPGGPLSSQKTIGQSEDPAGAAAEAGSAAGENLASLGLNLNLAPVLDVYRNPGDFTDQTQRSYSDDPDVVASLGSRFVVAQQAKKVAATVKHFPGLGSASSDQDTDLGAVTLNVPAAELRGTDERPYRRAIAAGVDLVMLSWAVYPALDPGTPAGLSQRIVGSELRGRLGFSGVTITDALEAKSLASYGSDGHRGLLAAKAGMDLLLCSNRDVAQGRDTVTAVADALGQGELSRQAFTTSLHRVMKLRRKLG